MFSAFSRTPRPFDLEAALESWATTSPDHPVAEFKGKPKRKDDVSVEVWLLAVENGCNARRVPKTHWPDVAKHFMVKKALGRVTEVEKVMRALHGDEWVWTWKDFQVAVLNMGWNIDEKKTRQVSIESTGAGLWKIVTGRKDDSAASPTPAPADAPKTGNGSWLGTQSKKALADASPNKPPPSKPSKLPANAPKPAVLPKAKEKTTDKAKEEKEKKEARPTPPRSASLFTALPSMLPKDKEARPTPARSGSLFTALPSMVPKDKEARPTPARSGSLFSLPAFTSAPSQEKSSEKAKEQKAKEQKAKEEKAKEEKAKEEKAKEKAKEEKAKEEKEKKEQEKKEQEKKEKEKKEARPTPARSGSLFSLPALPFLRPPPPQPEQTMLNRISAQVPVWLLAATEALATLANDNPDVLTAIATGLVAVGTMSAGGTAAIAAVGEAAVVVGRALKNAHDKAHGRGPAQ